MAIHKGYEAAGSCTGKPQPGVLGAMAWFRAKYESQGGVNLGIYNCRKIAGSKTLSLHGEGRAADFGIRPHGASYGTQLAEQLRLWSKELGIQCIIWNRRIWSGGRQNTGWSKYEGSSPHVDHLHVEFTWATARKSEQAVIDLFEKYVGRIPAPIPPATGGGELKVDGYLGPATIRRWQEVMGTPVDGVISRPSQLIAAVQKRLKIRADGHLGPQTIRAIQAHLGTTVDGVISKPSQMVKALQKRLNAGKF